jgi:hypothetical protein
LSKTDPRLRLSGAFSVQAISFRFASKTTDRPRNLFGNLCKLRVHRLDCQPIASTGFPPVIHKEEPGGSRTDFVGLVIPKGLQPWRNLSASISRTRQNTPSDRPCENQRQKFGTSRRGRHSLDKRSLWRFLRKTQNPFGALCPRIEPRGRG